MVLARIAWVDRVWAAVPDRARPAEQYDQVQGRRLPLWLDQAR